MKLNRTLLTLTALAGLVASIGAATVGPAGYTTSFPARPAAADWATLSFPPSSGTYVTNVAMIAASVQTNLASSITAQLNASNASPPLAVGPAVWVTNGYVQTRPTGNAYTLLKATLVNATGSNATSVRIGYLFSQPTAPAEEVNGLVAFYSLTGAANDWTLIPELSTNSPGTLTANVTLTAPWNDGSTLYLLWVDDNGSGGDTANQIDNFSAAVTGGTVAPTTVTLTAPTNGATFAQGATVALAATSGTLTTNVDFYVDGAKLTNDTTSPYTANLATCALGTGPHFVHAVATAMGATATSATNTFTLNANTPPTVTLSNNGPSSVLVGTAVTNVATVGDDVAVVSVDFYLDGNKVYTRTVTPWQFTYNDSTVGTHLIHAVATDNCGLTTTSGNVSVTVVNPTADYQILVANGASWKWFASATGPTTDWAQPNFDDSGWSNGIAELGFGDNQPGAAGADFYPEVTLVPRGVPPYITYYFRKTFNVADASLVQNLSVRLLCDDGGVVHLNGQPIWTNNFAPAQMTNAITNATLSANAVAEGTIYQVLNINPVPAGLLSNGLNQIAVEVHQSGTNSSDLSFDLMLWGQVQTPPSVAITAPVQAQSFAGGCAASANVTVTAVASFFVTNVSFTLDGAATLVSTSTASPFSVVFPAVAVGPHSVVAAAMDSFGVTSNSPPIAFNVMPNQVPFVAITNIFATNFVGAVTNGPFLVGACAINRLQVQDDGTITNAVFFVNGAPHFSVAGTLGQVVVNDLRAGTNYFQAVVWDNCGLVATSAPVAVIVTNPPQTVLLANGLEWKYWYSNSAPALQGAISWSETNYDDSLWLNGFAELGYDDIAQNNPETTNIDPTDLGHDAAYFRRTFAVTSASQFTNLLINLLVDDGGVVYVNGQEVFRCRMPATGVIAYATFAIGGAESSDGTVYYQTNVSTTGLLHDGINTVAVEVHQASAGSSDISFDLMLWAEGSSAPPPLTITYNGTDAVITWSGSGFKLQQKNDLAPAVLWDDVLGNPQNTHSVPVSSAAVLFFKLVPQ